jgi:hemin uptake protein HemP
MVALAIENDSHYIGGMLADPHPPKPLATSPALSHGPSQVLGQTRHIDSATLLGPQGEVLIVHQQQVYRLRVTSLGKLILTK